MQIEKHCYIVIIEPGLHWNSSDLDIRMLEYQITRRDTKLYWRQVFDLCKNSLRYDWVIRIGYIIESVYIKGFDRNKRKEWTYNLKKLYIFRWSEQRKFFGYNHLRYRILERWQANTRVTSRWYWVADKRFFINLALCLQNYIYNIYVLTWYIHISANYVCPYFHILVEFCQLNRMSNRYRWHFSAIFQSNSFKFPLEKAIKGLYPIGW